VQKKRLARHLENGGGGRLLTTGRKGTGKRVGGRKLIGKIGKGRNNGAGSYSPAKKSYKTSQSGFGVRRSPLGVVNT